MKMNDVKHDIIQIQSSTDIRTGKKMIIFIEAFLNCLETLGKIGTYIHYATLHSLDIHNTILFLMTFCTTE